MVLSGGSGRSAAADRIGQAVPQPPQRLLIRCPRDALPPQSTPELLQGFDTDTQITARAVILARIALGCQGIRVGPIDLPTSSPAERRKLLRDGLRLVLWRAAGSTGAWLAPEVAARKRAVCGV